VPAVVENRRTGLLVPPNDPEALAAAIGELLRRPDWAKELATAGCESVGERFGTGAMVRAVEAVYEKALKDVRRET
jgi:rhamnosyl/mannosyltransferase